MFCLSLLRSGHKVAFGRRHYSGLVPGVVALSQEMKDWRHDFHMHPELSFEEFRTAEIVANKLEKWGIQVTRNIAKTGVVGTLEGSLGSKDAGAPKKSIGLRADMDALAMEELNEFSHRSTIPGRMHGCGHDGHTTMLLGAAKYLASSRNFEGTVHFIFQPAEEEFGGGSYMVREGLFERFPCDSIYGMHNWPLLKAGEISVRTGAIMASCDEFKITINGKGGHAAMPHLTVDPIYIGSQLVSALQALVSRATNPLKGAVLSVTTFHAGGPATNVIPEQALLQGTIRSLDEETRKDLLSSCEHLSQSLVSSMGGTCEVAITTGYPVTVNSQSESEFCAQICEKVVGSGKVLRDVEPTMGAEDFSYMLQNVPGCYLWLGQGKTKSDPMVHHPQYDFNDDVAPIGASLLVRLVEESLKPATHD
jgi:amidohydrolase